jgi:hypothetical protein
MLCFLASYLVAFILELSRLVRRSAISRLVMIGFGLAGFLAHTLYLLNRSQQTHLPPLLASTHDWMLVLAWVLALCYLILTLLQKDLAVGVFVLPVVLLLAGSAHFLNRDPYSIDNAERARRAWVLVHAALLVFGVTAAAAGFLSGMMYLVQHHRLKLGKELGHVLPRRDRSGVFLGRINFNPIACRQHHPFGPRKCRTQGGIRPGDLLARERQPLANAEVRRVVVAINDLQIQTSHSQSSYLLFTGR